MYKSSEAKKMLAEKYGWQTYGEKHEESVFTKWFQSFWLFEVYGIDKRKAHFSSLIVSGQMTREEAMIRLAENPIYPKLGIEDKVMKYPKRPYTDFATDERLFNFISMMVRALRSLRQ